MKAYVVFFLFLVSAAFGQIGGGIQQPSSDVSFTGTLSVSKGGTGGTTASEARSNLGALSTNGSAAGLTNFPTLNQNTTGTASNVTGIVSLANGGTGTNTAAGARTALGLGSAATNPSSAFSKWYAPEPPYRFNFTAFFAGADRTANGGSITARPTAQVRVSTATNNGSYATYSMPDSYLNPRLGFNYVGGFDWTKKLSFGTLIQTYNTVISTNATNCIRLLYGTSYGSYTNGDTTERHVGFKIIDNGKVYGVYGNGTNAFSTTNFTTISPSVNWSPYWFYVVSDKGNVFWYVNGSNFASVTNGPNTASGYDKMTISFNADNTGTNGGNSQLFDILEVVGIRED